MIWKHLLFAKRDYLRGDHLSGWEILLFNIAILLAMLVALLGVMLAVLGWFSIIFK